MVRTGGRTTHHCSLPPSCNAIGFYLTLNMSDMDVFAAMGIAGFGKKPKQRQLDPNRFEKNKRGDAVRDILQ